MKALWLRIKALDANVRSYWIGIGVLFIGLTWHWNNCIVVGGVLVLDGVITSYLVAWLNSKGAE